jgi:hypothetical protein
MPLIKSTSKRALSKNIAAEIGAGRPARQAAAIGYATQRAAAKKTRNKTQTKASRASGIMALSGLQTQAKGKY